MSKKHKYKLIYEGNRHMEIDYGRFRIIQCRVNNRFVERADVVIRDKEKNYEIVYKDIYIDGVHSADQLFKKYKTMLPSKQEDCEGGTSIQDVVSPLNVKITTPGVSGTIRNHFLRKTVVAYSRGVNSAAMIIKLRGNKYKGIVAVRRNLVSNGSNVSEIDVKRAVKMINQIRHHQPAIKELSQEDRDKITAQLM